MCPTRSARRADLDDGKDAESGAAEEMSFEDALKRLEAIVQHLERGDESLERSLALFEEGVRLSRLLTVKLEKAQARIDRVVETGDGGTRLEPEMEGSERDAPEPPPGSEEE